MSRQGEEAVKSLNKELNRIERKFNRLTDEDKAGRAFLIVGIILIGISFTCELLLFRLSFKPYQIFLLGFLTSEILITGYSLIHKSLRGAWL